MVRREGLAGAAAWGLVWGLAAALGARLVTLAGLALLARILAPAEFGLFAFALVTITYVESVGDLGAGMALVYWPSRREDAAQVAFLVNLVMGFCWLGLTLLAAPVVAAFFRHPEGEAVLRALAWSFPIKALGNAHDALCQKDLRFRARLAPELGLAGVKAGLSVVLAMGGFGAWSLVWGQLAGQAAWTLLLWTVVPWRPRPRLPVDLLRPMLAYGRGIVAVNVLAALLHHADLVVVGRLLGAAALGFYQMASKVPEATITVLVWIASRVLFPAFARIHAAGEDLGRAYAAALRYVSLLTLPSAVGLALLAPPLVLTLFGPRWGPAVPVLQALSVYAGLRSLGTHAGEVLKATGRTGLLATLGLVKAAVLIPALLLGARGGALGVATALAAVTAATVALNLGVAVRLLGLAPGAVLAALRPGVVASAVLALAILAWRTAVAATGPAALLGGGLVGLGAYLACLRALSPEVLRQARESLSRRWREESLAAEAGR